MFNKFILKSGANLFEELLKSANFENITKGRLGGNLVDYQNGQIPLVRSTTNYHHPNQKFLPIHYALIDRIKKATGNDSQFNNAMIEVYTPEYCKMGYHSDQSLDLSANSSICIFTCYSDPGTQCMRTLRVKNKHSDEHVDILMEHNSIIVFTVPTNQQYVHKIILEPCVPDADLTRDRWLGITFRQSKTFIHFRGAVPYFSNITAEQKECDQMLTIADKDQLKEFYKSRSLENSNVHYIYPEISYTISAGDIIPID
jgi:alkylated DNA repair dioxygenase AlkB